MGAASAPKAGKLPTQGYSVGREDDAMASSSFADRVIERIAGRLQEIIIGLI